MNKVKKPDNKHFINKQIRANNVRVIFEESNSIMTLQEALSLASLHEMDLVQFSPGECPTCRILNYSKYRYQEEKKRKSETANKTTLKEIQIRPAISTNDLDVKSKQVIGFLEKGNDVRLRIKLRGREKANADQHSLFLVKFADSFQALAKVDGKISQSGIPAGGVLTLKPYKSSKPV